jgi:hypothetical protein
LVVGGLHRYDFIVNDGRPGSDAYPKPLLSITALESTTLPASALLLNSSGAFWKNSNS